MSCRPTPSGAERVDRARLEVAREALAVDLELGVDAAVEVREEGGGRAAERVVLVEVGFEFARVPRDRARADEEEVLRREAEGVRRRR